MNGKKKKLYRSIDRAKISACIELFKNGTYGHTKGFCISRVENQLHIHTEEGLVNASIKF